MLPASGLVLVGYRGTGKSTVSRIVAERTGCPHLDVDAEIERRQGRSIRAIFDQDGEAEFRQIEATTLREVIFAPNLRGGVIATGGGAILAEANRATLQTFGLVVWLTADPDTLARRLAGSRQSLADRPALTAAGTLEEVATVLATRTPLYRAVADVEVVSGSRSVVEVADAVIQIWHEAIAARNLLRKRADH